MTLPLAPALGILAVIIATAAEAQVFGPRTEASECAAAIGGNVTDSKVLVVCGIPPDELDKLVSSRVQAATARNEKIITLLERNLDLNERQIRAALDIVGEANVPPEQLAAKLVEIARRFAALRDTAAGQGGDSTAIVALRAGTQRAIEAGELTRADQLLADIGRLQDAELDRRALSRAQTSAQQGAIALTRLRYREAATHFAAAASRVPADRDELRHRYLIREADALWQQGAFYGDRDAATVAIDRYRALLARRPREQSPREWAESQFNIGTALTTLGTQEPGTVRLEQAVAALSAALQEFTRERSPDDWAYAHVMLGTALSTIGLRESGTARLEEAVVVLRAAAEVLTRERVPTVWATIQTNVGLALTAFGAREAGTARLEEAVAAHRAALQANPRERAPHQWGVIQLNLGMTLRELAGRESGTQRIEESIAAFRAGLQESTRERVPLQWFSAMNGLALALVRLAERGGSAVPLGDAVRVLRDALAAPDVAAPAFVRENVSRNLAEAERLLAEREAQPR